MIKLFAASDRYLTRIIYARPYIMLDSVQYIVVYISLNVITLFIVCVINVINFCAITVT